MYYVDILSDRMILQQVNVDVHTAKFNAPFFAVPIGMQDSIAVDYYCSVEQVGGGGG